MENQIETKEKRLQFKIESKESFPDILTENAMFFLIELHEKFNKKRIALLEKRKEQQQKFDEGELPNFPIETKKIRESEWIAASTPEDLLDRRVEITGPVD